VKQSEFKRWLASMGATFTEGTNHTIVHINGVSKPAPLRHGSKEIGNNLVKTICKQLGLKKYPV